jgi:hypothetical protein
MDNAGLTQSEISLEDLENQITELAGQLNAANYRWLMLIAEFDRRAGWRWSGERMDYDMALVCLFGQRDRYRERQRECQLQSSEHVSAETPRTAH